MKTMKIIFEIKRLLAIVVFLFVGLLLFFKTWFIVWDWMTKPSNEIGSLRGKINLTIDINGYYPQTPEIFNSILNEKFRNIVNKNYLDGYYYVGGLNTNDSPYMPIIIKKDEKFLFRGWFLMISRASISLSGLNKQHRKELFTEPWKLVENDFDTLDEYMAFTNRLRLYKITTTEIP